MAGGVLVAETLWTPPGMTIAHAFDSLAQCDEIPQSASLEVLRRRSKESGDVVSHRQLGQSVFN
ncbi:MAG: hypothetical protein KTR19_04965 [Hyphomicrobiales bacterium]|nr:hypothetical protein [Hyphomicrobiales bacterium]